MPRPARLLAHVKELPCGAQGLPLCQTSFKVTLTPPEIHQGCPLASCLAMLGHTGGVPGLGGVRVGEDPRLPSRAGDKERRRF